MQGKGKKRARGDASIRRGEGGAAEPLLPTAGASTATRAATAAETALILTAQSGLLVSWTEATELQRATLALCEACRRCTPVRVRVTAHTPRAVWARGNGAGGGVGGGGRRGVPGTSDIGGATRKAKRRRRQYHHHVQPQQQAGKAESLGGSGSVNNGNDGVDGAAGSRPELPGLQISSLMWEAPASHLGDGGDLPPELRELTFGRDFNRMLSGLVWPARLERLTFGSKFNRNLVQSKDQSGDRSGDRSGTVAVGGAVDREKKEGEEETALLCLLPRSLKELTFGKQFNKPLPKTLLPPGLVSLSLGRNFRHRRSVRDAVWPVGVKVVRFGEAMLKRERRDWPRLEAMRGLAVSSSDHPAGEPPAAAGFAWPAGLDRVEFWQEGRAVVSLKGGRTLEGDSLEWLASH